jgi:hypothetical protein
MRIFKKHNSKRYIIDLESKRVQFIDGKITYGLWWSSGLVIKVKGNLDCGQDFNTIEECLNLIKDFHNDISVKK